MNHPGWDIDRIVSEVLRRLQSHAAEDAIVSPPKTETKAKPRKAQAISLDDRVVTLASVKDKLQGIRQVRLRGNAVVTPSAKDEFRKRGISVERGEPRNDTTQNHSPLVVVVVDTVYEAASLLRQAGGELIGSFEMIAAVRQLVERVTDRQQLGVLITNRTAPALCLANRHPGVRAAWGANVEMVRDAVATVGANLLVIDPTGRNLAELTNSVREFKRSATRNCPAEFREVL